MNPLRCAASACLASLLIGCVTSPGSGPAPPEPARTAMPSREQTLERDYHARATALMHEGRWADAKVQWELLLMLRPGAAEYRTQWEIARKQIADTAAAAIDHAAAARKRGDLDPATIQYLRALAADRENTTAAQGLREIERERTRRAYLNRPPRTVLGIITGNPSAPVELESDYMQRQKPGNGDNGTRPPRR
jgi:hypothetical protein